MSIDRARIPSWRPLVLALAVIGLAGCDVAFQSFNHQTARDTWAKSYALAAGGRVEVENQNGRIRLEGIDGGRVEVSAERVARGPDEKAARERLGRVEIGEQVSADAIRLETRRPAGMRSGDLEVNYTLKVPKGAAVRLHTSNGEVHVVGVDGAVRAATTNGGVRVTDVAGAVEGSTTNGSISVEARGVTGEGIRLETINGSITVTVPGNAKADVTARSVNGGVRIVGLDVQGEKTGRAVEGRVNGGGPRIDLRATNGAVRIVGK